MCVLFFLIFLFFSRICFDFFLVCVCVCVQNKENIAAHELLKYPLMKMRFQRHLKENEDSGISSIRSNNQCELSAIEKCDNLSTNPTKDDTNSSCSNVSKR